MECHVASCPAQKLLNNRRHKSEISIKSPFGDHQRENPGPKWEKKEKRDTHRAVTAAPTKLTHGCTSLMYACQRGDTGGIIRELRNKPGSLRVRDRSNKTALHYCSGQENLVAAASVALAAPELMETADEDGLTPLHMAVIQGNLNLVNLLLANQADVNALDSEGHSVVHWATVCGEIEALRAVLMAGADVSTPDINGGSPLHYAAQMCGANYDEKTRQTSSKLALEILNILLKHPKTSVDVTDKDGRQPLLWAASAGSESAVLALIKGGARVESCDKDGLTALHCAASRGHTGCIDTIIGLCGAPTDLIDCNGCTALHYAVTLGHADATSLLLAKEADPNRQDRKGRTPAHCGCAKGQFETVKILHSHKANLWLRNARGDLPVHEAASSGRRELVQWLLEQRPKQVNTTSNDGRSLLHTAAANDNTEMSKMLIDFGADVNSIYRTMRNVVMTPLDCALQKGHRSTAKFLQLHGGLPASKLRLSGRNNVAATVNDQELVRPLKFDETKVTTGEASSTRDSSASGKATGDYVVYVKRSDSESSCEELKAKSSSSTSKKKQRQEGSTMCSHHQAKQCQGSKKRDKSKERRRTSSCSESFLVERDQDGCEKGMNRCKSNMEIRRRHKSKETCCPRSRSPSHESSSTSESDSSEGGEGDCCKHQHQQRKSSQSHNKNCRRYKVSVRKQQKGKSPSRSESEQRRRTDNRDNSKNRVVEMCDKDTQSMDIPYEEFQSRNDSKSETVKDNNKSPSRPPSTSSSISSVKKRPQSARVSSAKRQQQNAQLEDFDNDLAQIEKEFLPQKVVSLNEILDNGNGPDAELLSLVNEQEEVSVADKSTTGNPQGGTPTKQKPGSDAAASGRNEEEGAESDVTFIMEQQQQPAEENDKSTERVASSPQKKKRKQPPAGTVTFQPEIKTVEEQMQETAEQSQGNEICHRGEPEPEPPQEDQPAPADEVKIQQDASQKENFDKPQTPADPQPSPALPAAPPATPDTRASSQPQLQRQLSSSQGSLKASKRGGTATKSNSSSFAVLSNDGQQALDGDDDKGRADQSPSRSSFKVMSSENVKSVSISDRPTSFKVLGDNRFGQSADQQQQSQSISTDDEQPVSTTGGGGAGEEDRRMRRLKKRNKNRDSLERSQEGRKSPAVINVAAPTTTTTTTPSSTFQLSRDQDSGFEPSPRAPKSKIPRAINHDQEELDGRNSRRDGFIILDENVKGARAASEGRKPGDKNACNMAVVNASIQKNIRRYYMERKIFQHLLELKSLQIRSSRVNEAVLVKRAVDDYHKSVQALGYETGGTLRRYPHKEYTFKNFEIFLYETLKGLQKHGTHNFQNISDVYKEAERRLSPDYKQYEKALQCTSKTHRCLHAAHAYTGIPCAAYIPMMNHHTIPKLGFGPYRTGGVGSFYLPKILTGHGGGGGGLKGGSKVSLELSQGNSKQLIPLPSDKLDSNKRYYVTFTVKGNNGNADNGQQQQQQQGVAKESKKVLPLN